MLAPVRTAVLAAAAAGATVVVPAAAAAAAAAGGASGVSVPWWVLGCGTEVRPANRRWLLGVGGAGPGCRAGQGGVAAAPDWPVPERRRGAGWAARRRPGGRGARCGARAEETAGGGRGGWLRAPRGGSRRSPDAGETWGARGPPPRGRCCRPGGRERRAGRGLAGQQGLGPAAGGAGGRS